MFSSSQAPLSEKVSVSDELLGRIRHLQLLTEETECRTADRDSRPWSRDVPYGESNLGTERQITITDGKCDPLVPSDM